MVIDQISDPYITNDENGKQVVKIMKLESRTLPHKANLDEDYETIEQMAIEFKRNTVLKEWIRGKIKSTYIRIDPQFASCIFETGNWIKK
jgi:peptidyl-prolyl cis-trans isomerase SurA